MKDLNVDIFNMFDKGWALVTAGDINHYNTMTISWGGLGTIWHKKAATVYIRESRYTNSFMENGEYFTVTFFDEAYKKDLAILGEKSGRDIDKIALTKLNPVKAGKGVGFKEAKLTLVCRKIYSQKLDKDNIPKEVIANFYSDDDIHIMYIGEVEEIL